MEKNDLYHILEYTKNKYTLTLKAMMDHDFGDLSMDDIYELLKLNHEQLKELLQYLKYDTTKEIKRD